MPLLTRKKPLTLVSAFESGAGWAHDGKRQQRALLASATTLMSPAGANRNEAKRLTKLRQPWQEDAWAYRDAIGELRYATTYLGNALRKIKLVPSCYVEGELEPLPLTDLPDVPPEIVAAANDALYRLSNGGPLALGALLRDIAENFEVAGECFLIGWQPNTKLPDLDNATEVWEIRSVSEVTASNDGQLQLRSEAAAGQDFPDGTFVQRLWYPHPRRKDIADSPFAAILDTCEELLILSRDIRASGRSRLASSGLLLIPDGLTVVKSNTIEDANDAQQDEFMTELIQSAMMAIQDEGSASAVVPIIIRGPADQLKSVKTVNISRPEAQRSQDRTELIERMATALDLPAEVLTGKADLNHWTAWSVDDDTFGDHVEPLVMVIDDALTTGYYRTALQLALGEDNPWASKIILWHDATRIVRHPDRSQDALQAYDRFALSDAALRDTMGFSDTDAPEESELLMRMMMKQSRLDPTIAAQLIKRMDATLDISQVKPEAQQPPTVGPQDESGPPPTSIEGPPQNGQPVQEAPGAQAASGVVRPFANRELSNFLRQTDMTTASAQFATSIATNDAPTQASITRGSKKLSSIDRRLADRLHTAANNTMTRALEKAGARIRTAASKTAAGRAQVANYSNLMLCFKASQSLIAAAGLDEQTLLNKAWDELQDQWNEYLEWGDKATVDAIADMLHKPHSEFEALAHNLSESADYGWGYLSNALKHTAHGYLSDSQVEVAVAESQKQDPDDEDNTATNIKVAAGGLVPFGLVRKALKIAGGSQHPAADASFDPTITVEVPSSVASGPLVQDTLTDNDVGISNYTWIHGVTPNPFEPHEDLNGVEFTNWTDEILANQGEWPDVDFFAPGDHDGCTCDFEINWSAPAATSESESDEGAAIEAAANLSPNGRIGRFASNCLGEFGGPGSGPQGGRHEKEKESSGDSAPAATIQDAKDAGMARQTAEKLERQGKLDDAVVLANTQQPPEAVDNARQVATDKYDAAVERIGPEEKAAAEERHAQSSRQGGDDRPSYKDRQTIAANLVKESGDGKTCPCTWCGRTLEPSTVSLDRLVPGSQGGPYKDWNLTPSCYGCNNERSDKPFPDVMNSVTAKAASGALVAADGTPQDQPKFPLGTWVSAKCMGWEEQNDDPDAPTGIPLEFVEGKLDGFYVPGLDYYKYVVSGYDVEPESIVKIDDPDAE